MRCGDVAEVSRALDASRGEITDVLGRVGSDPVSRSAEALPRRLEPEPARRVRAGGLARRKLHTASSEYQQAEQRLRGHLGSGADGGPA